MATRTAAVFKRVVQNSAADNDCELLRRFAEAGDQSAFAAIVRRHTGLVYGVCRRALSQPQDAEDACQATFLILAEKAKSAKWQPSVANWLYTTARRVARNARVMARRRAAREGRVAVPAADQPIARLARRALAANLADRVRKLPPRRRQPLEVRL